MNQNTKGLVVDLFAGAAGASTGIAKAIGRSSDIAINHDANALALFAKNHPTTKIYHCDIYEVHPLMATQGRDVDILWASPSCTHFSRARAGVPKEEQQRTQPYVVTWWARYARPSIIFVENVPEIVSWGPLDKDGFPDKEKAGRSFRLWIHSLKRYGYDVEFRILTACDYGAPTSRTRFFLIARCDGMPIDWPEETHAEPTHPDVVEGKKEPWHTTAEIINWNELGHSIFLTHEEVKAQGLRCKRPLAASTLRRVAKGMDKYVFGTADPFLIHMQHGSNLDGTMSIRKPLRTVTAKPKGGGMALVSPFLAKHYSGVVGSGVNKPIGTITAVDHHSLVAPTLIQMGYGERLGHEKRVLDLDKPLGTVVAGGNKFAIASAFITKHNHTSKNYEAFRGQRVEEPLHTITSRHGTGLVVPFISKMRGQNIGYPVTEPMQTISAKGQHHAAVGCMIEYYGTGTAHSLTEPMKTATTKDRFGLVTADVKTTENPDTVFAVTPSGICFKAGPVWIDGEAHIVIDIKLRMLFPRELARGQGFPDSYVLEEGADGRKLSTKVQVEKIGNSVPPAMSEALVLANYVRWNFQEAMA